MSGGHGGLGTDNLILATGVVTFCIAMVGVFASSEASILSANQLRIEQLAKKGDRRAEAFCYLRDNEDKMFATILAVENMFIIFSASFGVTSVTQILGNDHSLSIGVFTLATLSLVPFILEFLIVLFGEITPKTYAARHATRIALLMARPIRVIVNLLYPLIYLAFVMPSRLLIRLLDKIFGAKEQGPSITEEELKMIIDRSSQEGILADDERDLIHNVFEFGDTVASEVMTNRTQLIAFEVGCSLQEALPEMLKHGYSQYPVYSENIDDILGILYVKDLLRALVREEEDELLTLKTLMRPTLFVPESKNVVELLEMMQTHRTRAVIVADAFGGTEGLVCVHDLVSEIVGDIDDASEVIENFIHTISEDHWRIQGQALIYDVNESLKLELPEGQYQTIAGFVLNQMGRIPNSGESFIFRELEFHISRAIGPRILELQLRKVKEPAA